MSPRTAKSYWRSLAQLTDDPRARAFLGQEFPEGASEPPQGVSRRTMMGLMGATLSLAGLTACRRPEEAIVPYVTAPEEILPGIPLHYATTMPLGRAATGLLATAHEGRPTKVEGNPQHPATRGGSSSWVQASILDLYDPDRSQSVRQAGQARSWGDFVTAWGALEAQLVESGGDGLALLTEAFSSPTLERLADTFRNRFPRARWVAYDPVSDESSARAVKQMTGQAHDLVSRLDRAQVILAIDADLLLSEPENIRHARAYADGRSVDRPNASMNRLYAVESAFSLTGANADQRLRLRPSRIAAFVGALAKELGRGSSLTLPLPSGGFPGAGDIEGDWVEALAADLLANRGRSLIVAGQGQPPEVHAAVFALNSALGNLGRTVTLHESPDAGRSDAEGLAKLVAAMREGKVRALVMLGGNPVYNAPVDLEFEAALRSVETTIHLSPRVDETSLACGWHLPQAHFLESWGDARSQDGTLGVSQPLIQPLFGGRGSVEILALMGGGEEASGYDVVRETWLGRLGQAGFEKRWNKLLFDGFLEGAPGNQATTPRALPARQQEAFAALARVTGSGSEDALDVLFRPSPTLYDGRWANNGWLQELPDPITKITWDNAVLLSPSSAESLDVKNEDVVIVSYEGREVEAPVWVVPGQADGTVVLDLGHGRTAVGRVGNGSGFNAYALRTRAAPGAGSLARLEKTGEQFAISETQHHNEMDELGEQQLQQRISRLIRETTYENFGRHPDFVHEYEVEHPPLKSLWTDHSYDEGYQWGMTIDLNACTGCGACVTACQSENNIAVVGKEQVGEGREMHWLRIDRYFSGEPSDPEAVFQPIPCMQCENAPCEQVCPVAATVHDREGLNLMVYNRCIGTRYCANNCPYKVRRFNFFAFTKDTPELEKMAYNPDVTVRSRGVMEKCTFCVQRINRARIDAKLEERAIRDGDVQTACQQACPSRAITFGNIRDAASRVRRLKDGERNYVLLGELNNRPRTSYLGKVRNPNSELSDA